VLIANSSITSLIGDLRQYTSLLWQD